MCNDVGQLVKTFAFPVSNEVCSNEEVALRSAQDQCAVHVKVTKIMPL